MEVLQIIDELDDLVEKSFNIFGFSMIKKEEYISFVKEKMFSEEHINQILDEYKVFIEEKNSETYRKRKR